MGAWGPGLYQDDVALDIKEQYISLLKQGKSKEDASIEVLSDNRDFLNDEDDAIAVVLSLADIQWKYGKLMPYVKEDALELINSGKALEAWKENKSEYKRREKILNKLKEKLEGPQPPEKKIKIPKFYRCEWNIGDTFAYKLEGEYARKKGIDGRYAIFIKVDEVQYDDFHIFPVVWIKITNDNQLPKSQEEIDRLPFFISRVYTYGRFLRLNYRAKVDYHIEKDLFHCGKFLVAYRWILENTSKRIIPKDLIFLGNFEHIKSPQNEFLQYDNVEVILHWKYLEIGLLYGIPESKLEQKPVDQVDLDADPPMIKYVLKREGKKFEDYLKYLDKNGIKY